MGKDKVTSSSGTTPICRCRVMYLGSAVPHATKDGLQGIQEPLRDLYPENGLLLNGTAGIDSWVSVWSNGILIVNVDDSGREVKRFFPIEALHYCAAVRYVMVPSSHDGNDKVSTGERVAKFLPLDSPFLRNADTNHPPLFACILRRTTGIKVLECHAFICKREQAANALVRCCFHAYADSTYAKQIDENPYSQINGRKWRSISALDTIDKVEHWDQSQRDEVTPEMRDGHGMNGHSSKTPSEVGATSTVSHSPDEDNYKVWPGAIPMERETSTSMRIQKPRQLIIPSMVPPPPPPVLGVPVMRAENEKGFKNSMKKRKKKQLQNGSHHLPPPPFPPPHILGNGYPVNFMSVPQISPQGHTHQIYAPASSVYSVSRRLRRGPPVIQQELPMMFVPNEEPVYIPPMRPLTPLSNYHHPQQHQPDQHYVQVPIPHQHYGTTPRKDKIKREKSRKESDREETSPFNTGIYRTKGHMNERAFSYSIRQEHRSRSNSLANIQFHENDRGQGTVATAQQLQQLSLLEQVPHDRHERVPNGQQQISQRNNISNGKKHHHQQQMQQQHQHYSDVRRDKELNQSFSNLHINGSHHHNHHQHHHPEQEGSGGSKLPKTASIKRNGKPNGISGNKKSPGAPPVPAPPPMPPPMANGKTVSSNHNMTSGKKSKSSSSNKPRK